MLARTLAAAALWVGLASPALADVPPPDEKQPPSWLPIAAAGAAVFPGLGHLVLGQPREAGIAFGATALPLVAGAAELPPIIFADLRDQRMPLWDLTAQEVWSVQIYDAFQRGREATHNAGFTTPLITLSPGDMVLAPFQPEQFLDPGVWSAVAFGVLESVLFDSFLPDPDSPPTPFVFTARSVTIGGSAQQPAVGFAANTAAGGVLALHAGVGEEALFRGVIQTELERDLGSWGGLGASSALFGLAHVGGINQTTAVKQFLEPGTAGFILGRLYQTSGYNLKKSIAAHFYYDTLSFAISALRPTTAGNNVLGLQFQF